MMKTWLAGLLALLSLMLLTIIPGAWLLPLAGIPNSSPAQSAKPIDQTQVWNIVALGDSLTLGVGDRDGAGYVDVVAEHLDSGKAVLDNFAISGYSSGDLLHRFSGEAVQNAVANSNLILLSIGGIDLFQGAQKIQDLNMDDVLQSQQTFAANAAEILRAIRELNPTVPIYWLGLYNPFENLPNWGAIATAAVSLWNQQTENLLASDANVIFVPIMDLFHDHLDELLDSDLFHPNHAGYRLIGERVIEYMQ